MNQIPAWALVHTATITPYAGRSSTGPVYGEPFTVSCLRQGGVRLVRDADGNERASSLTLYCAPGMAASIPPGSLVEWTGHSSTVMQAIDHDSGGLGAPDHTEVVCE